MVDPRDQNDDEVEDRGVVSGMDREEKNDDDDDFFDRKSEYEKDFDMRDFIDPKGNW